MAANHYPGETFNCTEKDLNMQCFVKQTGHVCQLEESIRLEDQLKTVINLTKQQRDWLQENVIKYRKLTLKYRNEVHLAFRRAIISGRGNFFLA